MIGNWMKMSNALFPLVLAFLRSSLLGMTQSTLVKHCSPSPQTPRRWRRSSRSTTQIYIRKFDSSASNVLRGLANIGLELASKMKEIRAATREYIQTETVFNQLEVCPTWDRFRSMVLCLPGYLIITRSKSILSLTFLDATSATFQILNVHAPNLSWSGYLRSLRNKAGVSLTSHCAHLLKTSFSLKFISLNSHITHRSHHIHRYLVHLLCH